MRGQGAQLAVFGGIPGERARVRLVGRSGHQDLAKWVAPAGRPHPDRVEPPCDRYVPCGACPSMHLTPSGQDAMRVGLYRDALAEVRLQAPVSLPVRGETRDVLHALELVTGKSDQGSLRLGVRGNDGRDVVPIPECLVVTPSLREVMKVVSHHLRTREVWPWDGHRGTLRAVAARQSPTTGDVLVTLAAARPNPVLGEVAGAIASAHPPISGVVVHLDEEPGDPFKRDEDGDLGVSVLYGRPTFTVTLGGLTLTLGAGDPFPEHPAMVALAAAGVVGALAPEPGDAVVEVGSGNGLLTLMLARAAGWAMGLEPAEAVARRARENAAANGLGAEFVSGPVEYALEDVAPRLEGRRPHLLLHGGTRGLPGPAKAAAAAFRARRVVVTGTNPRALARDVRALVDQAELDLVGVDLWDVRPHTPFVLATARLVSRDPTPPTRRAPRRKTLRG